MRDVCPCSVPLRMWPIRLAANCLWKFNGLGSCVVVVWCSMVASCPGTLCPVRMARTLHDTACRFSSPALLSLKTACSSLLFSLRIILYFFTYYLHNTSGSLTRISSNHKVAMHASSGLKASWLGASSGVHRRGSVGPVGMRVPPLVY